MTRKFSTFLIMCLVFLTQTFSAKQKEFTVYSKKNQTTIYVDANDYLCVKKSAELFQNDVFLVTGKKLKITHAINEVSGNVIIIGSPEKCEIIHQLESESKISLNNIKDKWEAYSCQFVNKPLDGVKKALVLTGNNRRGTCYAVFNISEQIGVSPWYWWADVTPFMKDEVLIPEMNFNSTTPSVQYRGIFLNDEDWGLQPWAAKNFEPETGDIGPKTYAKIFELLLRLKANTIWPAMHNCTKAFYHYPANPLVADTFAIVIGSSHAEPMLRNNVDEWDRRSMGQYNYKTNSEKVYNYWEQRAKESSDFENIYTIGMRGIHDSGMEGMSSMEEQVAFIEKIFADQREIIANNINEEVEKVPQAFTPYKEVLDIYDNGLELPDDVTIVWPDDNYGYIRRLNSDKENNRKGGSGVYYHASYWGRPHDYLWLSTTHPALIREEMTKAFTYNARKIWILNVGDIKPLEYNIQLFLDMAWNIDPFMKPGSEKQHLEDWYGEIFGDDHKEELAAIRWEYYDLAFQRRPEFMGWSQTEPTRDVRSTNFQHFYFGDQAHQRMEGYKAIAQKSKKMQGTFGNLNDAYFQLVMYPVVTASLMNQKILYNEKASLYAKQGRAIANEYSQLTKKAYDQIDEETDVYNNEIANGKWNQMMNMAPRSLPVFQPLTWSTYNVDDRPSFGISVEGDQWERLQSNRFGSRNLPVFYNGLDQQYFVDVFSNNEGSLEFNIEIQDNWLKCQQEPILESKNNVRCWFSIVDSLLPERNASTNINFESNGQRQSVRAYYQPLPNLPVGTFVESNNLVSINAENFNEKSEHWRTIEGLGYTGSSVQYWGKKNNDQDDDLLKYTFYANKGKVDVTIYYIPVHAINNNYKCQLGVSILGNKKQVANLQTFGRSEEWKENVLANQGEATISFNLEENGLHDLHLIGIDKGVIIDRIIISRERSMPFYGNVKENKIKN